MTYTQQVDRQGQLESFDQLVLCSQSPRRSQLLEAFKPQVVAVSLDESGLEAQVRQDHRDLPFDRQAIKVCCQLARAKAEAYGRSQPGDLLLAADTLVFHQGRIHHKPQDIQEAETMLRSYFGHRHQVVTAVCLKAEAYLEVFYSQAWVTFVDYASHLAVFLQAYLDRGEFFGKSGAYGIQDLPPAFIQAIEGDIHTIIGLPVSEVVKRIGPAWTGI